MIFDNDNSVPFEEELPISNITPSLSDGVTRIILNGRCTSNFSNTLRVEHSEELVSKLTDSIIQMLVRDHFYESFKDAVRKNIKQQPVNRLEWTYTSQVELEYRIKPVIKNDDLDRKKWHQYSEHSRNEIERSIKEMLEGNRKEY